MKGSSLDLGTGREGSSRWFVSLIIAVLLLATTVNLVRPMLSYRVLELGVSPHLLGLVAASFVAVPAVLALVAGRLVDRYGTRKVQLAGATVFAAATIGLGVTGNLVGLVIFSGLCGLGHMLIIVTLQTIIANESSDSALDRRFGHYTTFVSAGQLTGPLLGAAIVSTPDGTGAGRALIAGGVVAVIGLAATIAIRTPSSSKPGARAGGAMGWPGFRSLLSGRGVISTLVVSCTVSAMADIMAVFLPAFGEERGLSVRFVSILLAIRAGASMVSRFGLGRMVEAVGRKRLLVSGVAVATVAVTALPLSTSPAMSVAAVALAGAALGLCGPLTIAWMASLTDPETRGTAISVRLTVNRLGQLTLPAVVGLFASIGGVAGVLWLASGIMAVSAAPLARLRDATARPPCR